MADRTTKFSLDVRCECGCGLPAPLARENDRSRAIVKGQLLRWRLGHAARAKAAKSYRMTSTSGRLVLAHRQRAVRALGRALPERAVVHHADGSKALDAPLVICQDQAYHMLLHLRMRVVAAGGNPNTDKICGRCLRAKPKAEFGPNRSNFDGLMGRCRLCRREEAQSLRCA